MDVSKEITLIPKVWNIESICCLLLAGIPWTWRTRRPSWTTRRKGNRFSKLFPILLYDEQLPNSILQPHKQLGISHFTFKCTTSNVLFSDLKQTSMFYSAVQWTNGFILWPQTTIHISFYSIMNKWFHSLTSQTTTHFSFHFMMNKWFYSLTS